MTAAEVKMDLKDIIQLVKDTHPRPLHVTQKQAGEMLGKSAPTIKRMVRDGEIKLNKAGMIPITEIDKFAFAKAA